MEMLFIQELLQRNRGGKMDIMLDNKGDLLFKDNDILLADSVAQKIKIRLLWFEKEWRWNREQGLPYFEDILIKDYDVNHIESIIRQCIFEIEEVTEVKDVKLTVNRQTRVATIKFVAVCDLETIREEVAIHV